MAGMNFKFLLSCAAAAAVAAAGLTTSVSEAAPLHCVGYEPFSNPKYAYNTIEEAVKNDLSSIKNQGFGCIKTYYSAYYGKSVAQIAANLGLKVVLGVWIEDPNLVEIEVNTAIDSCKRLPNTVMGVIVGNENMPNAGSGKILGIRNRLRNGGCWQPIGTSQTIGYYLNKNGMSWDLLQLDFLGYTVYPFFTDLRGQRPVDNLKNQISQLKNAYSDIFESKFIITETGWPTGGGRSIYGNNEANWWSAKTYAEDVGKMICNGEIRSKWLSYFIYNDPTYKKWAPAYEREFGLANTAGTPKFDLSPLVCRGQQSTTTESCPAGTNFIYGKDFPGLDVGSEPQSDPKYCCQSCGKYNCQSWVWTNYNGGTCFYKSGVSSVISLNSNVNAVAWRKDASTQGGDSKGAACQLLSSTDFYGNDIGSVSAGAPQDCFSHCYNKNGCKAFSYFQGVCYLKSTAGSSSSNSAVTSGRIASLQSDTDYYGNDLKNFPSTQPSACCGFCASTNGCKGASWSSHYGGTCWLKSDVGSLKVNAGVQSVSAS